MRSPTGRREAWDRKKVLAGIIRACEKRPVSVEKMEEVVTQVEHAIQKKSDREVQASRVGELVMEKLKLIDIILRCLLIYNDYPLCYLN